MTNKNLEPLTVQLALGKLTFIHIHTPWAIPSGATKG